MKKFWYLITILRCPICLSEKAFKERQYTPRPKHDFERYKIEDSYDYCDV